MMIKFLSSGFSLVVRAYQANLTLIVIQDNKVKDV